MVEERNWDHWRLELGGRGEYAAQDPKNHSPPRSFGLYNVSAGVLWKFVDGYGLGLTVIWGQRAPSTEELYIHGAHHGTATFQTGNNRLTSETTNNVDFALRRTTGWLTWKVNVFHNWIGNYIFVRSVDADGNGVADRVDDTGALDPNGEFLVQNFTQAGARFYGAEAEVLFALKPDEIDLRLFADYVRGKLDNGSNIPRMTPPRFGLEFNHKTGPWRDACDTPKRRGRTGDCYPRLYPSKCRFQLPDQENPLQRHQNFPPRTDLLNEEMRVHTSFLKNFAPLPGRALVVGLRGEF